MLKISLSSSFALNACFPLLSAQSLYNYFLCSFSRLCAASLWSLASVFSSLWILLLWKCFNDNISNPIYRSQNYENKKTVIKTLLHYFVELNLSPWVSPWLVSRTCNQGFSGLNPYGSSKFSDHFPLYKAFP